MRTYINGADIPEGGVRVVREGTLVRLFFDFGESETTAGEDGGAGTTVTPCESVDVKGGATYARLVAGIVDDRYTADDVQALVMNKALADDPDSGITEEKRAEYLAELSAFQSWRARAKEVARAALGLLAGK